MGRKSSKFVASQPLDYAEAAWQIAGAVAAKLGHAA
jgi:hypothetical protein